MFNLDFVLFSHKNEGILSEKEVIECSLNCRNVAMCYTFSTKKERQGGV